ncbi:uncharacterized protein K460DRAFT_352533 [Cucurbitaria berberidis CBS 394.84]|uniref:Uncharacterized protein n=1 Tax=Cucurbitaria berberidis CBS 394.84 TaxID=1168544 RepID=A0A9P4LAI3_9PLEO|nr:uncharacterized protein K460DRAFT_352533 [Cucurbitaria berberidis CBS 394.84]KAF1847387.1 hypothetical protein K460DRAFT_352533 [Cucurbitaria berberidis CBS 394.84]
MAGYGNRTAPDYVAENLQEEHTNTRLGLTDSNAAYSNAQHHGSGTTGGAGFDWMASLTSNLGNKRSSVTKSDSNAPVDEEEFRFGLHKDTAPYSNATPHGSGSTGGAGFGNKTGSFSESSDSTLGKVMEKAGHMMNNEKMAEKGRVKREEKGFGQQVEQ